MRPTGLIALAAAAVLAAAASSAPCGETAIALIGSELVLIAGGVAQPRDALVGATLTLALEDGGSAEVRIARIAADPGNAEGDVILYDLAVQDDAGRWGPVCEPEADGSAHAILQPVADGRIAIFCTGGALGKCIRFGYRPWAERDGVKLDAYWRACVRMVRADYCGDDQPTTRDGMLIDYYDRLGIRTRENVPGLTFEAAWDERGAICVAHSRVPQKAPLDWLAASCPRLAGRLGAVCTEEGAARFGTPLIINGSRGDGIPEAAR